ncbi:hypothetical protein EVAR_83236_1 [Eumeta japonica]|uniref:Uncharacterized protein n=1 Tax=Eumeta variegata TaxID=151549 RepID=A0A4C1Y213_EUMVA|nr:hypothetical protein EVAR_83236_1 [Eumeta japonica]
MDIGRMTEDKVQYNARNSAAMKLVTTASQWRKIGTRRRRRTRRGALTLRIASFSDSSEQQSFMRFDVLWMLLRVKTNPAFLYLKINFVLGSTSNSKYSSIEQTVESFDLEYFTSSRRGSEAADDSRHRVSDNFETNGLVLLCKARNE